MADRFVHPIAVLCFAPLLAMNGFAATVNGTVKGTVVDDTGKPVSGARVFISHALPSTARKSVGPPTITGAIAGSVLADSSGSFEATGIRAGDYVACAQTTAQGLLDPCHWAQQAPEFTVTAGQTTAGIKISMAHGAVIPIHVNDPQGLLTPATTAIDLACQFHIVTARGLHYNATIQASSATGRDYSITVPFGAPVTLQAISPHLALNDSTGNAVSAVGAAVNAPTFGSNPTLVYTVTGKK